MRRFASYAGASSIATGSRCGAAKTTADSFFRRHLPGTTRLRPTSRPSGMFSPLNVHPSQNSAAITLTIVL